MKQPTQEQIKEFWEWCRVNPSRLHTSCGDLIDEFYPPLDLNSLFKYAVPELVKKIGWVRTRELLVDWVRVLSSDDSRNALALLWAITQYYRR